MSLYDLCLKYLDNLILMESPYPESWNREEFIETMLNESIIIRSNMVLELHCKKAHLNCILDNLDVAIGFKSPIERYDRTRIFAMNLKRFLVSAEVNIFIQGKSKILKTQYGKFELS